MTDRDDVDGSATTSTGCCERARVRCTDVDIDLEVEAIVDRIGSINKRIKRGMEATLAEHGLTHPDWQVLTTLRLWRSDHRSSPGELAADIELSSGAMTSRLDRLEEAGYVRRLPDPEDRRGVVVELTDEGREAWDDAASVQGRTRGVLRLGADEGRAAAAEHAAAQADGRVRGARGARQAKAPPAAARRAASPAPSPSR